MPLDLLYPTGAELKEIGQIKMPNLMQDRAIFDILPMVEVDQAFLMWEQMDNFVGLMQVRGYNGQPGRVKKTGANRYLVEPGVYGEFEYIDEKELTLRRQYGTFNQPIDVSDLTVIAQNKIRNRLIDRMEWIGWTLLATGTFSVPAPTGGIAHTDSFTLTQFTSAVPWATAATATPLADLRAVQLLSRGISVNLGGAAKAYANTVTVNKMLSNINNADLYGRRVTGLATANNLAGVNSLYTGDNLPTLVQYDNGYLDDLGVFHPFIPDNTVIVVGQRPGGQNVGDFAMTRNATNPGMAPGIYSMIVDNAADGPPRSLQVHEGFNGGPRIYYPSSVVVMHV